MPDTGIPRVTVVVPTYQAGDFIEECVGSVLGQTFENLWLIVVDDGSTDGTLSILRGIADERLTVVSQANAGANAARNRGLSMTDSPYVAFLDADDGWSPDKLLRQIGLMESDPTVAVVGSLMRYVSRSGRELGTTGYVVDGDDQIAIAGGRLVPFTLSSALFRADYVRQVGGFDEALPAAQDLDLMARVAEVGRFVTVDDVLGSYRIHSGSLTMRRFALQRESARFVRARLAARRGGGDLAWSDFHQAYRRTWRQRYGDYVQFAYRSAGLAVADRDWMAAIRYAILAGALGPRYALTRLRHQRGR